MKLGSLTDVTCSECSTLLRRRPINPNTGVPIVNFFCGQMCKAAWQRRARPVTREWLEQKYLAEKLDCNTIGRLINRDPKRVWEWLREWDIPTRSRGFTKGRKWTRPSPLRGRPGKRGEESPSWQGGITPERQALYASNEWREVVKAVFARDKKRCRRCSLSQAQAERNGVKLHVHHVVGFRVKALRTSVDNLVLLCKTCHLFVHSRLNVNREFRAQG